MKKILFFTPTGLLTGSEIVLFQLIKNIDRKLFTPVGVITQREGILFERISSDIPSVSFVQKHRKYISIFKSLEIKLMNKNYYQEFLLEVGRKFKSDIWYINTLVQPDVLQVARILNIPCIVHSHELEQMLVNLSDDYIQSLIHYPKLIISCSQTAKRVVNILGRNHNLEVCYPTLDVSRLDRFTESSLKTKYREKYSLPQNTFIWAMSGTIDVNKNPVRFLDLAHILLSSYPDTYFIWLGGNSKIAMSTYLKNYAQKLGISERIRFVDSLEEEEYYQYFTTIDAFILTSYKESFSIVLLEAMYLGKPIVSLNSGGPCEIISDKIGIIVDSWDNKNISLSMIKVMNGDFDYSPELARQKATLYDIKPQVDHWNQVLSDYLI